MRDLERQESEEERTSRSFTASQEECSAQGLVYVAGYLCNKLAHKYEWMGTRTYRATDDTTNSRWIQLLSRGGLYLPSQELQDLAEAMENDFQKYHGPSLSLEKNSINILAKILQIKNIDMPYDLLQLFSRTRFFIRLKYLNNEMKVLEKTIKRRYSIHVNKFI